VDLARDAHGPELRRDGAPRATRDHQRGEHRAELPREAEPDDRAGLVLEPYLAEVLDELEPEHRAGEEAREPHDEDGSDAHELDGQDEIPNAQRRAEHREDRGDEHLPENTYLGEGREKEAPHLTQRRDGPLVPALRSLLGSRHPMEMYHVGR